MDDATTGPEGDFRSSGISVESLHDDRDELDDGNFSELALETVGGER